MRNRVIVVLLLIAVVFSVLSIVPRYNNEKTNNGVELVLDDNYLNQLTKEIEKNKMDMLKLLKKNGITGIAVYDTSIRTLINEKKARLIPGNELKRIELLTSSIDPLYKHYSYDDKSAFFVLDDKDAKNKILSYLPDWCEKYELEYQFKDGKLVIFFAEWKTKYLDLSIGFNTNNIKIIHRAGLDIIPRLSNNIKGNNQWDFLNDFRTDMIIFTGSEITGYKDNLAETAVKMNNNKIKYGMIESFIAAQSGSDKLAELLDYELVRVHSIQQKEMDKYSNEKVINRYLRAVRERNVRVLYLKPFLKGDKDEILKENIDYFNELTAQLKAEGYKPGDAGSYSFFASPLLYLILTGLGIFTVGIILLEKLLKINLKIWFFVILLLAVGFEILLIIKGKTILLRQVLALGSSIIFPTLAIITALNISRSKNWLLSFFKTVGISLLGVLFLIASLSELSFMLKVNQFRGVKLSFIIPLILISCYYYREYLTEGKYDLRKFTVDFLETDIKIKHVLLLLLIGVGGIIYIGRTGNYPVLPVPSWEITLRDLLEKYLIIRPRFKAFLFGHPFLIVVLALFYNNRSKLFMYPLILLASVGQITILNTFSHIHTPLRISLIRFVNGIWMGLIGGIVLLIIIKLLNSLKEKVYG